MWEKDFTVIFLPLWLRSFGKCARCRRDCGKEVSTVYVERRVEISNEVQLVALPTVMVRGNRAEVSAIEKDCL